MSAKIGKFGFKTLADKLFFNQTKVLKHQLMSLFLKRITKTPVFLYFIGARNLFVLLIIFAYLSKMINLSR